MLTIGHSTHPIDEFLSLLQAHGAEVVVDVRAIPRSRRNPQFNRETLSGTLERAGIRYVHMPGLGGLRRPHPDSDNAGWRNESFRGFADYMQTPEFDEHVRALIAIGERAPTVIMCAEAVPWRCHRSLIADALCVRGIPVEHIMTRRQRASHTITPWAAVEGTTIRYHKSIESEKS